jgi:DNA repair protein RadD
MDLYTYQVGVVNDFDGKTAAGHTRIVCVAPTGAGKTIIASAIIRKYHAAYKSVLFLSHRIEITKQTSDKLTRFCVPHGVIQADLPELLRPQERIQVASIQTLVARAMRSDRMELPSADLIIFDEAHHCLAKTYRKIAEAYPDAIKLGLTATPCRGDNRGLGTDFGTMIQAPQVPELIKLGVLVPTRVYAPVDPDLKGVRTVAGDYNQKQLAERMDQSGLVGDIISHWLRYGERRKTVCFATSVEHSIHIRDEFCAHGVRCEHIDGSTPEDERNKTLARLASGDAEVVSNCMVLTEGWDMPEVGCIILARPTKSFQLYRQMIGRAIRSCSHTGKQNAIVLDHAGATFRHGLVEDPVEWTLDEDHKVENKTHEARTSEYSQRKLIECPQCSALRTAGEACPHCGFLPQRRGQAFVCDDGELGLIEGGRAKRQTYSAYEQHLWHAMLAWTARENGYKLGWAAHKHKEKFGGYPTEKSEAITPIEPTAEVRSWVRSRQIAYAKGQEKKRRVQAA